jgi:hypothetical protein
MSRSRTPKGLKQLWAAVGKEVGLNSEMLAKKLVGLAIEGDTTIARLLLSLAEREPEGENRGESRKGLSLAERLKAEPVWQERPPEPGQCLDADEAEEEPRG